MRKKSIFGSVVRRTSIACFYGIDFPDPKNLLANQFAPEEMSKYLGVDSIGYLDIEGMVRATGLPMNEFCLACFNGDYPVPTDPELDKFIIEHRKARSRLLSETARASRAFCRLEMSKAAKQKAYAAAGVDIELGNRIKKGLHEKVRTTFGPEVLGRIGGFGGLFRADFRGMKEPILVSSIDGVGTKLKIAIALGRHASVAQDLVNHCIDDIAVTGARPLFFLDYIGAAKLEPSVFDQLISGFTRACKEGGCALIGGETAQLPDLYRAGEYDLAGCIIGLVDRAKMLDGSRIVPSDILIGLPSNGLHTNGYTLARKILLNKMRLDLLQKVEGLTKTARGRTPADPQKLSAADLLDSAWANQGGRAHHRWRIGR